MLRCVAYDRTLPAELDMLCAFVRGLHLGHRVKRCYIGQSEEHSRVVHFDSKQVVVMDVLECFKAYLGLAV
jgi:hypothetical protein